MIVSRPGCARRWEFWFERVACQRTDETSGQVQQNEPGRAVNLFDLLPQDPKRVVVQNQMRESNMDEDASHKTPVLMLSVDQGIVLGPEGGHDNIICRRQIHAARHPHQKEDTQIETDEYVSKRAGSREESLDEVHRVDALAFGQHGGQRPEPAVNAIGIIGRRGVAAIGARSEFLLSRSLIQSDGVRLIAVSAIAICFHV